VDVSIVEASAIKLPTVPKLARLHAIIVGWRATCRVIARWKPRPRLATSVVRKVTSRVTARRALVAAAAAGTSLVVVPARNVTAVVKSDTLHVRVPKALLMQVGMAAAEVTVLLVVVTRRATRVAA